MYIIIKYLLLNNSYKLHLLKGDENEIIVYIERQILSQLKYVKSTFESWNLQWLATFQMSLSKITSSFEKSNTYWIYTKIK